MRARKLVLEEDKRQEIARLLRRAKRAGEALIAARLTAVIRNSKGQTSGQLAEALGYSPSKVSAWLASFERDGVQGLLKRERWGPPFKLNVRGRQKLLRIWDMDPEEYAILKWGQIPPGWRKSWTFPMLAIVVEAEFDISYSPGAVRAFLAPSKVPKNKRWYRREPLQ